MAFTTAIPVRSFTRASILDRLRQTISRGEPIIGASAGAGIVAKCAEIGGADFLIVLCTGRSRHLGVPTTVTLGNANTMTLETFRQIDNVVDRTPIIGAIEATHPTRRRLPAVIPTSRATGLDGGTKFPSVGATPGWGKARDTLGPRVSPHA